MQSTTAAVSAAKCFVLAQVADASRKFVGLHLGRHQLAPMGYAAAQHPSSAREAVLGALGQGAQALGVSTSGPMMLKVGSCAPRI